MSRPNSPSNTHTPQPAATNATSPVDKLIQQHPLQRLASPSRSISSLIHILGLASFASSFNYLVTHPNHINQAFGWHFQFLTIIGLSLATLTFTLGLLADTTLSPTLFTTKNLLSMCSAPMEVLISVLYWGLRAVDPALVVPPDLELPLPADLGFHLAPAVFLVLDLLLLSPPWSISAVPAVGLSSAIALAYWLWIEACFQRNGFYPYPLFELLAYHQRIALFAASAFIMAILTLVLKAGYGVVNGRLPLGGGGGGGEGGETQRERLGRVKG